MVLCSNIFLSQQTITSHLFSDGSVWTETAGNKLKQWIQGTTCCSCACHMPALQALPGPHTVIQYWKNIIQLLLKSSVISPVRWVSVIQMGSVTQLNNRGSSGNQGDYQRTGHPPSAVHGDLPDRTGRETGVYCDSAAETFCYFIYWSIYWSILWVEFRQKKGAF